MISGKAAASESIPVWIVAPGCGSAAFPVKELWLYRELFYFLIWRDIKVRYKQTLLGAAWAILQPLLTMVVFTLFFGRLAGIGVENLPYPLFAFAGLLIWNFFAQGISQSATSLVSSSHLITKVYFPRQIVPLAAVLSGLPDLFVASPVLWVMMAYYGVPPGLAFMAIPLIVTLAIVTTSGVGLWLSALNVEYRDVRYVVPFLIQIWLFVTPVIYPASAIGRILEQRGIPIWLLGFNPMAGVVEGFRWAMLRPSENPATLMALSTLTSLVIFISGALYFRRVERSFADVV